MIIDNDTASDAVFATLFIGLPDDGLLAADGTVFRITYEGGDGNDVVLTVVGPGQVTATSADADVIQVSRHGPVSREGHPKIAQRFIAG